MRLNKRRLNKVNSFVGRNRRGSNCWSTTAYLLNDIKAWKFIDMIEMQHYLDTSFEELPTEHANLKVGDVLAFYSEWYVDKETRRLGEICFQDEMWELEELADTQWSELSHTALFIGHNQFLHQAGFNGTVYREGLSKIVEGYGDLIKVYRRRIEV